MFIRWASMASTVVFASLAVACGSSEESKSDAQEIIGSGDFGEGTLGAQCGGFVGVGCAEGFICITEHDFPDALGTCEHITLGSLGATCGGIAALKCNDGLTCAKTAAAQNIADSTGTCTKAAAKKD